MADEAPSLNRSAAHVYWAPEKVPGEITRPAIFLSGSTSGSDWRETMTKEIGHLPITIFNPKRDDWDDSWEERASDPRFREQVQWEMDQQERCDVAAIYIDPATESPVTLLELGVLSPAKKVVSVCCPEGFWRMGNVEMVCERFGIPLVETLDELVEKTISRLESLLSERSG